MLPRAHRLRSSAEFTAVLRGGRRRRGRYVMAYFLPTESPVSRVGFIVSRAAAGNSVGRHRVVRRIRAVVGGLLPEVHPGSTIVLRVLPAAATATTAALHADISGIVSEMAP